MYIWSCPCTCFWGTHLQYICVNVSLPVIGKTEHLPLYKQCRVAISMLILFCVRIFEYRIVSHQIWAIRTPPKHMIAGIYRTREIFDGGKLVKLANHEYLPKFSLPIFTDIPTVYLAYALTVAYLPNFILANSFTCTVYQNFPPPNISRVW